MIELQIIVKLPAGNIGQVQDLIQAIGKLSAAPVVDVTGGEPRAGTDEASQLDLSAYQVELAERRRRVLERWQAECRAACRGSRSNAGEVTDRFLEELAREGLRISRSTLYRWSRDYRVRGMRGLMDRRAPAPKRGKALAGRWISLKEASERSGRSSGHLRRQCRHQYAAAGLARLSNAPSGQTAWQIAEAADPAFAPLSTAVQAGIDARSKRRRGGK